MLPLDLSQGFVRASFTLPVFTQQEVLPDGVVVVVRVVVEGSDFSPQPCKETRLKAPNNTTLAHLHISQQSGRLAWGFFKPCSSALA